MNATLVNKEFQTLSGLTSEKAAEWMPLCTAGANALQLLVRPEADTPENRPLLISAAAADAFYRYSLTLCARDGDSSFSAGDVTVKQSGSSMTAAAKVLYENAYRAVLPLLSDNEFLFSVIVPEKAESN